MKSFIRWADKFEDKIRYRLSRHPIAYTLIGGVGIVLFYRGIWHWADYILFNSFSISPAWDGPVTIFISVLILLPTGLLVSSFIGNHIIISGIKGEKKLVEKNQQELLEEEATLATIKHMLNHLTRDVQKIRAHIDDQTANKN